jgi:hypothetical protein
MVPPEATAGVPPWGGRGEKARDNRMTGTKNANLLFHPLWPGILSLLFKVFNYFIILPHQ